MRSLYDFSKGKRGTHARRYTPETPVLIDEEEDAEASTANDLERRDSQVVQEARLIPLAPDVADAFPDADSVNAALRLLTQIAQSAKVAQR